MEDWGFTYGNIASGSVIEDISWVNLNLAEVIRRTVMYTVFRLSFPLPYRGSTAMYNRNQTRTEEGRPRGKGTR